MTTHRPTHARQRQRPPQSRIAVAVIVLLVGLVAGGGLVMIGLNDGAWPAAIARLLGRPELAGTPVVGLPANSVLLADLDGRPVVLDPPPPEVEPADGEWDLLRQAAGRLRAPGQGLDVALLPMQVRYGVVNPPTLRDAFEVTPQAPGAPRVIAMHAVRGGRAAGNALFSQHEQVPRILIGPGDLLQVAEQAFVVDEVLVLDQQDAAASERIWGSSAGQSDRLVIITCLQHPDATGPAEENLVVFAHRT